ncbi:ComEC/Rec2 family competence protein [Parapedomonas caeni]
MGEMVLRIWDVEHGACAMLHPLVDGIAGRLAMIDSGCMAQWRPSTFIRQGLNRGTLDYLFITNADQDHMSDLEGLEREGIFVDTLFRNPTYTGPEMYAIKSISGPVSADAQWYVQACGAYDTPTSLPFNANMGGITANCFFNHYPQFTDTNDLSLVVFIEFAGFKILFPGDLEKPGWRSLLQRADFRAALNGTNILVASHHGRESGFCKDVFNWVTPDAVVISDKPIAHATQLMAPDYRRVTRDEGVIVRSTMKTRHVLTTRRDGWIQFTVGSDGSYFIDTECAG